MGRRSTRAVGAGWIHADGSGADPTRAVTRRTNAGGGGRAYTGGGGAGPTLDVGGGGARWRDFTAIASDYNL